MLVRQDRVGHFEPIAMPVAAVLKLLKVKIDRRARRAFRSGKKKRSTANEPRAPP